MSRVFVRAADNDGTVSWVDVSKIAYVVSIGDAGCRLFDDDSNVICGDARSADEFMAEVIMKGTEL